MKILRTRRANRSKGIKQKTDWIEIVLCIAVDLAALALLGWCLYWFYEGMMMYMSYDYNPPWLYNRR